MIYSDLGEELLKAYNKSGATINSAYDFEGTNVFTGYIPIMSLNMQWFRTINGRADLYNFLISKYDPLIIGAQEYRSGTYGIGTVSGVSPVKYFALKGYPNIYETTGLDNGNAIISKISANSTVQTVIFEDNHYSGTDYGYQKAYFTIAGKTIALFNTHLSSNYESDKVSQAAELYEAVQNEDYFIITCDLNTICTSVNDTEYTTIMKQFVDAGYNCANCTEQHGFIDTWTEGSTASGTWEQNDNIITSANITIKTVIADNKKIDIAAQTGQAIDHLPLIAYLTIN